MDYPVYLVLGFKKNPCLRDDIFYLILLFLYRNTLDSLLYVFFPPIILLRLKVLSSFYIFSLEFSLDRIYFYVSPIIGLFFIL